MQTVSARAAAPAVLGMRSGAQPVAMQAPRQLHGLTPLRAFVQAKPAGASRKAAQTVTVRGQAVVAAAGSAAAGPNKAAIAYGVSAAALVVCGLRGMVDPAGLLTELYAASPAPIVSAFARLAGAGMLLAAVVANSLKDAAEADRLGSSTYQRLNLALIIFSVGLLAVRATSPVALADTASKWVLPATAGVTAAASAAVYQSTAPGGLNPLAVGKAVLKDTAEAFNYSGVAGRYGAFVYGMACKLAAVAGVGMIAGTAPVVKLGLLTAPLGALGGVVLKQSGLGLLLASAVLFVLKDAAARNRLGASTFKALNIGAAVFALAQVVVLRDLQASGLLVTTTLTQGKVALAAGVAVLSLWNYASAGREGVAPAGLTGLSVSDPSLQGTSDPLEKFCGDNPDADECRVFED